MPALSHVPIVILGAGPSGAACALALARRGVGPVCVVEAGAPAGPRVGETLPPDARLLLDELGLWDAFLAEGHEPCLGSCSAWGSDTLGWNDFLLQAHGPGYHLDRSRFDAFLLRHARAAGAEVLYGTRFLDVASGRDGHRLRFSADQEARELTARFVIDATGRRAAFARKMGARRVRLDTLHFVVGFFEAGHAASQARFTLLEAARDGWWYAAGLPEARVVVAFATDAETVAREGLGHDHRWLAWVLRTRHVASRLDGCRLTPRSVVVRAVSSGRLDPVVAPTWRAVGDAAAIFDPLSAQGLYKALQDGIEAAADLTDALAAGTMQDDRAEHRARQRFAEYMTNRNYFYGLEQRWPQSPFWQRRQARQELTYRG